MKYNYDWFEPINEDVSLENNPAMDDNDFEHPTSVGEPTMNEEEDSNKLSSNEEEDSDEPSFQERVMLIIN